MKHKNTRKKHFLTKRKNKTSKGGFINFFRKTPKTTQEVLNDLQRNIGNMQLKNIERVVNNEVSNLYKLRDICINNCKRTSSERNDAVLSEQLNSMIQQKSDYEWGNLCANSMRVSDCTNYLQSYKKLEFYKNYVDQLNNKTQQIFNNYVNSIKTTKPSPILDNNSNNNLEFNSSDNTPLMNSYE